MHHALLDALTASSLRVVRLEQCGIEYFGANIIQVFVGHPFLEDLSLESDFRDDNGGPNALGEEFSLATALGELVAFDSPALRTLKLAGQLRERALPLFDALAHNTHLQHLELNGSCMNAEFLREVVFPRVRANTSLLVLNVHFDGPDFDNEADDADYQLAWPIMDELRDFVRDRAAWAMGRPKRARAAYGPGSRRGRRRARRSRVVQAGRDGGAHAATQRSSARSRDNRAGCCTRQTKRTMPNVCC